MAGEAALDGIEKRAVLAAHRDFKIADVVVLFDFSAEYFTLLSGSVESAFHVERHQLFAGVIAQHLDKSVVAIDQFALRSHDKDAFLDLLEQEPVFFLSCAPVRGVADNVDGAFLLAALVGVRRGRNQRVPAKAGVGTLDEVGVTASAVGAILPGLEVMGQDFFAGSSDGRRRRQLQTGKQSLIDLHHFELGIVGENDVLDRIECINPLALRAQNLLHQPHVLDGHAQLVAAGFEKL